MTPVTQFNYPTQVRFGPGAMGEVPEHLAALGIQRPLLVTDKIVAELPPGQKLASCLANLPLDSALFSGIWGNPVISQVQAGVAAFREHKADGIVALGGGASMDVAKIIALVESDQYLQRQIFVQICEKMLLEEAK